MFLGPTPSHDATPDISYGYDRRGRRKTSTQAGAVTAWAYGDGGNILGETYTGGPLNGLSVTNDYISGGLRQSVTLLNAQGQPLHTTHYEYSNGRIYRTYQLNSADTSYADAYYDYANYSGRLEGISFYSDYQSMSTVYEYDRLARLTNVSSATWNDWVSYGHTLNAAGQRSQAHLSGTIYAQPTYWQYTYDSLGQVTGGTRHFQDGTPMAGQQFGYAFDDIGNRKQTTVGGGATGLEPRYANYTVNSLNQYTQRTVPGYTAVMGTAHSNAVVTLVDSAGNSARALRQQEHFFGELPVTNYLGPVWLGITNYAVLDTDTEQVSTNNSGAVLIPPTPQVYSHDGNGNLTSDGLWIYHWDAENRLIAIESSTSLPESERKGIAFQYDAKGRRIEKVVSAWDSQQSNYIPQSTNRFVYDGWNVIAVLDGNNTPVLSFIWGADLSGTMQGAGGVGGLLAMNVHAGPDAGAYFYCYDGNGNVIALVNAATATIAAQYEYGPFGELLRATGPMAKANPFRFSTKYQDDETDVLYYGHRYYNASTGRWLSRDPYGEKGFRFPTRPKETRGRIEEEENLYAFVDNFPVQRWDFLGLLSEGGVWPPPENEIKPPPKGPFKQCRIALRCTMTAFPGTEIPTTQKHCGLVIDTGDGVYQLDGSGGTENRRNLTVTHIFDIVLFPLLSS